MQAGERDAVLSLRQFLRLLSLFLSTGFTASCKNCYEPTTTTTTTNTTMRDAMPFLPSFLPTILLISGRYFVFVKLEEERREERMKQE